MTSSQETEQALLLQPRSSYGAMLSRGYMWNKIILKLFQCFISHVTAADGYVWNKHWNYFRVLFRM